jgi:2-amino-4-hydroxy-6-hydroxymethyldihydropteridine diphosphokinase
VLAKTAFLSLGSNVGAREQNLQRALAALERERIRIIGRSSLYETEPQDFVNQSWFLNMAVACQTTCFPLQLLAILQRIERELGRVRGAGTTRKGPRTIDIDILLFGTVVMNMPQLIIPHPRMLERRFVLEPLIEIAPDLRHSETKQPLSRYLSSVAGQKLRKLEPAS